MSDEMLKRRVQRLFRALVLGGAAIAGDVACTSDEEPATSPQNDAGDLDSGDDDSGSGPLFW